MARRHVIDRRVVERPVVADLDDRMVERRFAGPARQALDILAQQHHRAALVVDEILGRPARHLLVVDEELTVPHLDVIARQSDDPLDVVGRGVGRQFEYRDIAAMRRTRQDPAGKQRQSEGQRIAAVAIGKFRHEQVIADQQCRDHRSRRDIERLIGDGADHQRDQHRINNGFDGLEKPARGFFLGDDFRARIGFHDRIGGSKGRAIKPSGVRQVKGRSPINFTREEPRAPARR